MNANSPSISDPAPMTSSNAPTNSTVIAFPKVLREAGGYVILELRREWKRELEVVEAQSREVISQLRAENAELRGLSREFLSAYKTEVAEIRATIEQQVNKRLAELKDGIDGKEGKEGSTGPQGPQGEKGERGEAGEIGERGAQGEKGERGEQGSQGAQGEKGEKGIDGTTGATGDRGEPGETGPAGPPGEPGSAGAPGAPGRPGTIGPIGPIGKTAELDYALLSKALEVEVATALASWPRPENGIDGKDGRDGIDGAIGAQGERGAQGQAGEQGPPGRLPLVKGWTDEIHYKGDVVVDGGGTYQALRDTAKRPGHDDWVCLAAPGRDGEDGRSPKSFKVCGTYDAEEKYHALDIVTLNSTWFIARSDAPGPCPGAGWQAGPVGRRGEKGERGSQGMSGLRGDKGDPAREILDWKIDEKNYLLVPVMSDGSDGPSVSFLTLFKQFHTEAG